MKLRLTYSVGGKDEASVTLTRTVKADYVTLDSLSVFGVRRTINCRTACFPFSVAIMLREPNGPGVTYENILTVEKIDD